MKKLLRILFFLIGIVLLLVPLAILGTCFLMGSSGGRLGQETSEWGKLENITSVIAEVLRRLVITN